MTTSEEFWASADLSTLRSHWKYEQKLSYDVQKIIPHIRRYRNISDIMCGEALVTKVLDSILKFDSIYLCDINEIALFKTLVTTSLRFKGETCNINERIPQEVIDSEMVLWLGGINCIIDDDILINTITQLNNVIIRASCYQERKYINTFSKELNANYEVMYRTKEFILSALSTRFKSVKYERLYPNFLESKFGGIQYLFIGERKY